MMIRRDILKSTVPASMNGFRGGKLHRVDSVTWYHNFASSRPGQCCQPSPRSTRLFGTDMGDKFSTLFKNYTEDNVFFDKKFTSTASPVHIHASILLTIFDVHFTRWRSIRCCVQHMNCRKLIVTTKTACWRTRMLSRRLGPRGWMARDMR